jgi:hypothetical protein
MSEQKDDQKKVAEQARRRQQALLSEMRREVQAAKSYIKGKTPGTPSK